MKSAADGGRPSSEVHPVTSSLPRLVLATVLCAVAAGCASSTSINKILAEPQRYANREITVNGTVRESASVLGRGAYQIEDKGQTLWVISDKGVPRKDARVSVTGTVKDAFDLGSIVKLPEAASRGLVLIEKDHRAR
jgi:hypothetical protein